MIVMSDSVRPHRWQPTMLPSLGFSRQEYWSGLPFPSPVHESEKWKWSLSVVSDPSQPHGLWPTRLLHPWDFPGMSTGVGCHYLLYNKAVVDVFLELSCFFSDPLDVGNLISGSSAFSKSSLTIWKFMVYILLKPGLENFEHYMASMWEECNYVVSWTFFGVPFLAIGMKTDLFQSCGHCWVFQICLQHGQPGFDP